MISSRGRAGTPEVFPFRSMRMPDVTTPLRTSSWGAALAAAAASMAWILYRHPLSLSLTFAAGLGLLAVLMLALVRFDAAVGLGVLLLAVVRIQPAPTDAVFAVVTAGAWDNLPVSLHLVSSTGEILDANAAELEMLGYQRDEYVGHSISEFHVDEPATSAHPAAHDSSFASTSSQRSSPRS